MSGLSWITIITLGIAVATSKLTIRNYEDLFCRSACYVNEICQIQYIVKATITDKQEPFIRSLYSSRFNLDEMTEKQRNYTLEHYGDYSYSLDILEVVMIAPYWDYPINGLPLDVAISAIRCGVNLKIGSTYILYGYLEGWLATGDDRRALMLSECTPPVEINASDPVPKRFLERNC